MAHAFDHAVDPAAPHEAESPALNLSRIDGLNDVLVAAGRATRGAADAAAETAAAPRRRRERDAVLTVREEHGIDFADTAALAAEGFDAAPGTFTPDGLRWLYERAFTDGTTVFALRDGERKVGHIALVHHTLRVGGRHETAVALVDLFILKAFRSRAAMAALYGAVERFCLERGVGFILAVPNGKAAPINVRHLKLAEAARLEIRVGLGGAPIPLRGVRSWRVADLDPVRALDLLGRYCGNTGDGLLWTSERLWARLAKPGADYALHLRDDLMLVSASRSGRRAPHTMLCAMMPRPGAAPGRLDVAAVVGAACRLHRRPLFVYAGVNGDVPLPGLLLPERMRPSPMVLQLRDLRPDAVPAAFRRFEPLDFDFA